MGVTNSLQVVEERKKLERLFGDCYTTDELKTCLVNCFVYKKQKSQSKTLENADILFIKFLLSKLQQLTRFMCKIMKIFIFDFLYLLMKMCNRILK